MKVDDHQYPTEATTDAAQANIVAVGHQDSSLTQGEWRTLSIDEVALFD